MFTCPLFQVNLHLVSTVLLSGFQSTVLLSGFQSCLVLSYSVDFKPAWELWNPLSKAVPGPFYGSGGHSKSNWLQGRANFHRCCAWQIILISNTAIHAYSIFSTFWFLKIWKIHKWLSHVLNAHVDFWKKCKLCIILICDCDIADQLVSELVKSNLIGSCNGTCHPAYIVGATLLVW